MPDMSALQPFIDFLTQTCTDKEIIQGAMFDELVAGTKRLTGQSAKVVGSKLKERFEKEEASGGLPLNHDLERGIRRGHLKKVSVTKRGCRGT